MARMCIVKTVVLSQFRNLGAFSSEYQQKGCYCWTMAIICQPREFN